MKTISKFLEALYQYKLGVHKLRCYYESHKVDCALRYEVERKKIYDKNIGDE